MANKVLTIYISSDAIRVAEMQKNNKQVILSNASEITTPAGCFNDGYLLDVTSAAEAVRQAIFGRGFSAKDVFFTISSKKIASKEVEVNYFKDTKKLGNVLQTNSGEYFPMSNSGDYVFAYSILEDYMTEEGRKYRVSAVAAPTDLIRGYYELADELKLNVKNIDYFGNSVIQLLSMQMTPGRTDLVIQIEKDVTYVNVMRGSVLVLQRSVNYGKNAVTNALMDVKKISEKDAKTLLSNETLLDQHVTADEYASAVQYLVNGIGRAVEYHRQKNPGELLQGIKIFGEGSSIAGIEKILQRELGAQVEHFDTLSGVVIRGQASLTAEEVLRYLPNIGCVIDPMSLMIKASKKDSAIGNADLIKALRVILALATIFSIGFVAVTYVQHDKAVKERDRIQGEIDKIKDIEEIANEYDRAMKEYDLMVEFEKTTENDNEYILTFIEDMEKKLPIDTKIDKVECVNGDWQMEVTTGWHDKNKNEVADVIVQLQQLDYVRDLKIDAVSEEYRGLIVVEKDEDGNLLYATKTRDERGKKEDEGTPIEYVDPEKMTDDEKDMYKDFPVIVQVQSTYELTCHIGKPAEEAAASEEGGAAK
ncbi:MAG: pilus assembly protein PilM [Lachnospiraceae bacterium]|nr:pilus assembly protein PilM [Lachnospiraceae bacterium]